jgi:hypothetical protein
MRSDPVVEKLAAIRWKWAEQDRGALEEMRRRIVERARAQDLITYSDLVRGITFHLGTVNDGRPFEIDTQSWSELHRGLVGEFLGKIAADAYMEHGFLLSAIAVNKEDRVPSEHFFVWARNLGLLKDPTESGQLEFWTTQVRRIYSAYRPS